MNGMASTLERFEVAARSRRSAREALFFPLLDATLFALAFLCTRWAVTYYNVAEALPPVLLGTMSADERPWVYTALTLAAVGTFWRLGHYARRRPFWLEVGDILSVLAVMALIDAASLFLSRTEMSRHWFLANWGLLVISIPLARMAAKHALMALGAWRRPTVIVGIGPNAIDAAAALQSETMIGFEPIAFLVPPGSDAPRYLKVEEEELPVLNTLPWPGLLPPELGTPHVVIALELGEADRHTSLVERIALASRSVDIVSPIRGLPVATASVTHYFSHDVLALRLHNNLASAWNRGVKRAFDLVMASTLLILLSPLFAWIALKVRDTGQGVVFGHRRIGRRGEPFVCYKFRTMVPDAEEQLRDLLERDPDRRREWEERQKLESDPRITPIGRFLRQTSLDELPQLWNVLRGDMSLVGPRPVVSEELARYGDSLPYYFECTPGLTGLWQISGRNDVDYRRRVHLDCWYVKNWSLWYDLVILLKTIPLVVMRRGAY